MRFYKHTLLCRYPFFINRFFRPIGLLIIFLLYTSSSAFALSPEEVLVVANKNASKSISLAKYYMEKRQIPEKNLVTLFITDKERCSREAYINKAVPQIRRFLDEHQDIRAIVTMYGIPLSIQSPGFSKEEQAEIVKIKKKTNELRSELRTQTSIDQDVRKKKTDLIKSYQAQLKNYKKSLDKSASFDSELALVKRKEEYNLNRWKANPYFVGFRKEKTEIALDDVILVSRLDGASSDVVKRVIDDTIEAEKNGLEGKAYFDARWKKPKNPIKKMGYGFYDQSIHNTAEIFKKKKIPFELEQSQKLFKAGSNLKTAFYCGWYSLARYIDAFDWQKGSIGYHIASQECQTLKRKSNVWCKKMLDKGAAVTIGPVGEPYVNAFPVPEIFFHFITERYMTVGEAYLISLPYLSWKMVMVGDPLYKVKINP